MTPYDEAHLDSWEGADTGLYRKLRLRVHTLEGDVLAYVYVLDAFEGGALLLGSAFARSVVCCCALRQAAQARLH